MDCLIDSLAALALVSCRRPSYDIRPWLFEDGSPFQPIPFTTELAALSLTNSVLRRNIFARKIVPFLELRDNKEIAILCERLTTETRSYVR